MEGGAFEEDISQVVSRDETKNSKGNTPSHQKSLCLKLKWARMVEIQKKVQRPRRIRSQTLLVKTTEGKAFAKVFSEIHDKPEDSKGEMFSFQDTKGGGGLNELSSKTANEGMSCETVKGCWQKWLEKPTCSLGIRGLGCLTEKSK